MHGCSTWGVHALLQLTEARVLCLGRWSHTGTPQWLINLKAHPECCLQRLHNAREHDLDTVVALPVRDAAQGLEGVIEFGSSRTVPYVEQTLRYMETVCSPFGAHPPDGL